MTGAAPAARGAECIELPAGTSLWLRRGWPAEPPAWTGLWGSEALAPPLAEIGAHIRTGGEEVWIVELQRHGVPVGVIPVRCETRCVRGLRLRVLSLAGADLYDYLPLAVAPEVPAVDLRAALRLAGRRLEADALALDHLLPPCPAALAAQASYFENRYFDAALAADGWRALARKESLRRHAGRARRELQYSTTHVTDPIPEALIGEIAGLHTERWRFDGIDSPFRRPERQRQYRACAARALVTVLRRGGEIVAAHVGLRAGTDTLLWHTPVINIRYLPWSPLEVLLLETVEECARRGLRVLDYGLGDEGYKARFSNATRPVWNLFLPVTGRGRLAVALRRLPAARALRQRLRGWRARLRAAALVLRRERCFALPPADRAVPAPPEFVLRPARAFGDFVDLMRAAGMAVQRPDYERYRQGQRFLAMVSGTALHAGGWLRPAADTQDGADEAIDIRARSDHPEALAQFLARLPATSAAARVVVAAGDKVLLAACRVAGLVETGCRRR